ncbi:hypothetical protein GTY75_01955 [Streptomyces sp. SID8381]|uniref:hypothetical protein n=1 Tax=unclassified Streptomyces TaxID=2593676 RepID=UPI000399D2CB|nr:MULTISPECIES: hypothetical protein [unclassified Streptomyces]MYX25445.1 hypothetical protein [Streptomyces sp. SID8381]
MRRFAPGAPTATPGREPGGGPGRLPEEAQVGRLPSRALLSRPSRTGIREPAEGAEYSE